MTLQGHVKNGAIIPDVPIVLPEGAAVQIEVLSSAAANAAIADWRQLSAEGLARAFGDNEPEYSAADIVS